MSKQSEDIAAIRQLAEDWGAGWHDCDYKALLDLLLDNAAVIMSGEDAIIGKEALRELYKYVFEVYMAEHLKNYTYTSDAKEMKVEVSGDLGYLWGTYTSTGTPKEGGEPIKDQGASVIIAKRQDDGSWKIALMIATRDQPDMPPAPSQ